MEPVVQRKTKVAKRGKRKAVQTFEMRPDQKKRRAAFIRALDTMIVKADKPMGIVYEAENGLSFGIVWGCANVEQILEMEQNLHDAICQHSNSIHCLKTLNNQIN